MILGGGTAMYTVTNPVVDVVVVAFVPGGNLRVPNVRRERPGGDSRDEPRVAG